jgi:hypothetical protein
LYRDATRLWASWVNRKFVPGRTSSEAESRLPASFDRQTKAVEAARREVKKNGEIPSASPILSRQHCAAEFRNFWA